jgi:hypothetical protein
MKNQNIIIASKIIIIRKLFKNLMEKSGFEND